jgi:hypothetical protein
LLCEVTVGMPSCCAGAELVTFGFCAETGRHSRATTTMLVRMGQLRTDYDSFRPIGPNPIIFERFRDTKRKYSQFGTELNQASSNLRL